jgi:methionyl-tRNA synthetase
MSRRQILVTSALPYVNENVHLGHLVEYIQTDIWVRFQKLRGHEVRYFCADDTHGTATMIRAQQQGCTPEELLEEMSRSHQKDFADFQVAFDQYGSTHARSNQELVNEIWASLRRCGHVAERDVTQLFDVEAGIFLADRFVKGTCPRCSSAGQYGDNCDQCGATYTPDELGDPVSTVTGSVPEMRTARHYFVVLTEFQEELTRFTQEGDHLQPETANWLKGSFLNQPLRDWDVSRPAPYFGFEIPDAPGHYFYVWVDAPVGYMSTTRDWCEATGEDFDRWWRNPECEIHHFIGKDIAYFHTLFWPAMLRVGGFSIPDKVHVHGFLTVNGEKMSKRKGTFIRARTYLDQLSSDYLRYYYASKLSSAVDDFDLNFEEFVAKVNADLVGKVVNLASRTARFLKGASLCDPYPEDGGLFEAGARAGDEIAAAYEACDFSKAMRLVMALADRANEYVESRAPWALKKKADKREELHQVCSVALNLFRQIATYLGPVLPDIAEKTCALLATAPARWEDTRTPLVGNAVGKFEHLMQRVDPKKVQAVLEATREEAESRAEAIGSSSDGPEPLAAEPLAEECSFEEFSKVDLRVARILSAESVEKADKLLKLELGLGGDERRTVFAGIKQAYAPEELVGRLTIAVVNLAPRKMRFGVSEGMVLASGPGGSEIYLLSPDTGARPGQRVK